jgi:hypothetical protein
MSLDKFIEQAEQTTANVHSWEWKKAIECLKEAKAVIELSDWHYIDTNGKFVEENWLEKWNKEFK